MGVRVCVCGVCACSLVICPKLQNYGTTDSSKYWHWGSQLSKCGSKKTVCFPSIVITCEFLPQIRDSSPCSKIVIWAVSELTLIKKFMARRNNAESLYPL